MFRGTICQNAIKNNDEAKEALQGSMERELVIEVIYGYHCVCVAISLNQMFPTH